MAEQDKKDLPEELPAPLLQFPCEFPMKVVGQRTDDFAQQIVAIIEKHAPDFNASECNFSGHAGRPLPQFDCPSAC